jgi:hypothetical protein
MSESFMTMVMRIAWLCDRYQYRKSSHCKRQHVLMGYTPYPVADANTRPTGGELRQQLGGVAKRVVWAGRGGHQGVLRPHMIALNPVST